MLIAVGTLLLSAGGALNSVADEMTSFAVTHAVGISVVFAGFLVTNRLPAQVTPLRESVVPIRASAARAG